MFRTFWKFVGVAVMALAVSAPVSHAKQRLLMGTSTGGGSYYVLHTELMGNIRIVDIRSQLNLQQI